MMTFDGLLTGSFFVAFSKDHIAIRDFPGAMENWGLIIYRDAFLLQGLEPTWNEITIWATIAHELGHMVNFLILYTRLLHI